MTKELILPVSTLHAALFCGPSAWLATDLSEEQEYVYRLPDQSRSAFENLLETISAGGVERTEDAISVKRDLISALRRMLTGRGFVVVRGIPVGDSHSLDAYSSLLIMLGSMVGSVLPQDKAGTLAFSVRNEGYSREELFQESKVRGASTGGSLTPHTDSAPLFGDSSPNLVFLFAFSTSDLGGRSTIASGHTVHNIIYQERPDLLKRLYGHFYFDRRRGTGESDPQLLVAPIFYYSRSLSVRYADLYLEKGYQFAGVPLEGETKEALTYFAEVSRRENVLFTFDLEPGDLLVIDNRWILHGRTSFGGIMTQRIRQLIRLWVNCGIVESS